MIARVNLFRNSGPITPADDRLDTRLNRRRIDLRNAALALKSIDKITYLQFLYGFRRAVGKPYRRPDLAAHQRDLRSLPIEHGLVVLQVLERNGRALRKGPVELVLVRLCAEQRIKL